ncbi:hypothetical protein GMMP1_130041 [Candidatus Magnetomoraceae bacterium gMMP-1]
MNVSLFKKLLIISFLFFLIIPANFSIAWEIEKHGFSKYEQSAPLTLNQSIKHAIINNHRIKMQNEKILEASYALKSTKNEKYPSLDFETSYGYRKRSGTISSSEFKPYGVSLILSKDIYDGGKLNKDIVKSTLLCELEKLNFLTTLEDIIYNVSKSFYDILHYEQQINSIKEYIVILTRDYNQISQRFTIGDVSKFELIMAEVKLKEQKNILLSYLLSLKKAKEDLRVLMNLPTEATYRVDGDLKKIINNNNYRFDLESNISTLFKNRTSLKISSLRQKIAETELKIERTAYYPDILAEIELSHENREIGSFQASEENDTSFGAYLTFTLPIMEYLKTKPKIIKKRKEIAALKEEEKNMIEEIKAEIINFIYDKKISEKKLSVEKENLDLLKQAVGMARKAYFAGAMSLLDVQQVSLSYIQAEMNYYRVIYELVITDLNFKKACGDLISQDIKTIFDKIVKNE